MKTKSVFQVLRSIQFFGKAHKTAARQFPFIQWQPIAATNGTVVSDTLYLSRQIVDDKRFEHSDILVFIDSSSHSFTPANHTFASYLLSHQNSEIEIDFLQLMKKEKCSLWLHYHQSTIGLPERENFRLCHLKKNEAVEVLINGKFDFSLAARTQRTYLEQKYSVSYLGDFDTFEISKTTFDKQPENNPKKVIDLRKILW